MKPQITETELKTTISKLRFVESINKVLHEIATVKASQSAQAQKEAEPTSLPPSKNRDYKVRKKTPILRPRAVTDFSIDGTGVEINHDVVSKHRDPSRYIYPVIVDAFEEFLTSLKVKLLSGTTFDVISDPLPVVQSPAEEVIEEEEEEYEPEDEDDDEDESVDEDYGL